MTTSGSRPRPSDDPERDRPSHATATAVLLAAAAALGGFLFGYDSSVINGAVDAIKGRFDLLPDLARGRSGPARGPAPD